LALRGDTFSLFFLAKTQWPSERNKRSEFDSTRGHDSGMTRINHTAQCDSSQFIAGKPFG
jgi:hypothetical protein